MVWTQWKNFGPWRCNRTLLWGPCGLMGGGVSEIHYLLCIKKAKQTMFFKLTNYRLIFTMVDVSVLCWYTNVALKATTKISVVYDSMLLLTPMTVGWGGENELIWAGLTWGWLYSTCPTPEPPQSWLRHVFPMVMEEIQEHKPQWANSVQLFSLLVVSLNC